ncbi:hypothetical protein FBZ84_101146 [Azospirillum baldaniorum]|uniref:hypothetical protein n=1 Tax=Azospirillum baldaniorum TaxID=1064539 RepID=UPI00119EF428|nr:hypothetical protein [Azospirillum baldaniorum]TWA71880.1 hypothetical protein FBZ84_101146 [Azospirillum baldaniorum]
MRDIPIIFSAPMVRALLDGRKTQTRRILSKRAALNALSVFGPSFLLLPGNVDLIRYAVGDRLWVRENWQRTEAYQGFAVSYAADDSVHALLYRDPSDPFGTAYGVGEKLNDAHDGPWRPSIHMPRWASRLTLVVEQVRVERLQDISGYDAVWEGIFLPGGHPRGYGKPALFPGDEGLGEQCAESDAAFVTLYQSLWNSIHGADAWDANPWVVAISFAVHRCNIDALGPTNGGA